MKTHAFRLLLVLTFVMLAGCGEAAMAEPTVTSSPPPPPTDTVPPTDTATPTENATATQSAQQTADAQATAEAEAVAETQAALDKAATATELAAVKLTATAGVQATSAALEEEFAGVIRKLQEDGKVNSFEGDYYRLDDFAVEEAKINYFFPYLTGYSGENFVFETDLYWVSASMNANWPLAGCGLIYGLQDMDDLDFTYLGLDGYIYSLRWTANGAQYFAFKKWGKPEVPEGQAHFLIAVYDKHFTLYVNDELTNSIYDGIYKPGEIAYSLVSGTNKDFGTRCEFTNTNLWIFK